MDRRYFRILIVSSNKVPESLIPMQLDHIAISVPSVDVVFREKIQTGASLHKVFTPKGPKQINEFWEHGVRYIFFNGPEGVPIEFCERIGVEHQMPYSHGHFGLRCSDIKYGHSQMDALDASHHATFQLVTMNQIINVEFFKFRDILFELFDEPPHHFSVGGGWIGLIEDREA